MGSGQQQSTRPTDPHRARETLDKVRARSGPWSHGCETMQENNRTTLQRIANNQFADTREVAT